MAQTRISQITGAPPLKISRGAKRRIVSALLGILLGSIALISGVFSPGTMLGFVFVRIKPSHRGPGVFLDAIDQYSRMMSFAWEVNSLFYVLVFAILTYFSKSGSRIA